MTSTPNQDIKTVFKALTFFRLLQSKKIDANFYGGSISTCMVNGYMAPVKISVEKSVIGLPPCTGTEPKPSMTGLKFQYSLDQHPKTSLLELLSFKMSEELVGAAIKHTLMLKQTFHIRLKFCHNICSPIREVFQIWDSGNKFEFLL